MMRAARFPLVLLGLLAVVAVWSAINPHDYLTWILETAPVFMAVTLLIMTWTLFPLTNMLYALIALHCVILLIGGHYTYALVPAFDWIREIFGFTRNHYDRVGHFMQGFVPAMVGRELLLRTSPLKQGKWLFTLILLGCLGISAAYEVIEWIVGELSGEAAESFLGTQGDVWDTQKDMAFAGIGAAVALLSLSGLHNRALIKLAARSS